MKSKIPKVFSVSVQIEERECVTFRAVQTVTIGLLQPAPATFYDYYEPGIQGFLFTFILYFFLLP